jgi:hypothetical protein
MEIGPVYTYNRVIRPVASELQVNLFPTVQDFQQRGQSLVESAAIRSARLPRGPGAA